VNLAAWTLVPSLVAAVISVLVYVDNRRGKQRQEEMGEAARTVEQRAQEWSEVKDTVDLLGGEVKRINTELRECLAHEAEQAKKNRELHHEIAVLRREVRNGG